MQLRGLTALLSDTPAISSLARPNGHVHVFGLLRAAIPAVVAAMAEKREGPLLVVVAHQQEASDLTHDLAAWTGGRVRLFPAIDNLPYERVRLDRAVLAERQSVVQALADGEVDIVAAPARALLQPVQSVSGAAGEMRLKPGEKILPDTFVRGLAERGYAETTLVDEPGTYARRGGVVDVFPAGSDVPYRVDWFGNEIESIRSFSASDQRSDAAVSAIAIPAIAALDPDRRETAILQLMDLDTSTMRAEAKTYWDEDLARLEAGALLDDVAIFAPYLMPEQISLLDVAPDSIAVCLADTPAVMTMIQDLAQQASERRRELEGTGDLPRGLRPALCDLEALMARYAEMPAVELQTSSPERGEGIDLSGLFHAATHYGGRLRTLAHDIRRAPANRILIASLQRERVAEMLAEENIAARRLDQLDGPPEQGVTLLPAPLAEGWTLPNKHVTLLSDFELFGRARVRPVARRKRATREAFFSDFAPGDFVVHIEHGIGRFDEITRMTVEGAEREYAVIQFAGTDRVYVPTDQLERLTRYVGMGDTAPHLSKLGGGEWGRARQRAQKAAEEIAAELIDIYSKRMARPGHAFDHDAPWQQELEASFPFPETPDQLRAVAEVKTDMEEPRPMDRLVCADVGYGKTEVAVRAAFKAVMDGRQVAVLVPTTILAQQHFETFTERFEAFPVKTEVLSRFRSPQQQKDILARLATGEIDVVIGTHRLLGKDVKFKDLGLLIIDEEQRFGVKHKEQLKKMRETVDVLTLTATPIPRTLHMGLVGIREISVIETPPEGRLPIKTFLQPYEERLVREAILRELDRDGQVYVVHNKVATIDAMAERVRQLVPEARVLVGHGQMEEAQLERCMLAFAHHEADVLICSTIIENGLDIPNVNTIIVNNAHRLGLTQLYQLRGRVGRSENQAYAYLLYPRDVHLNHDAARRLEAVFEAQDLGAGFTIAMKDLEIRGAGNLLGAEQSGHAAAVGFDLYTRMVSDAVERLRGVQVEEPAMVTIDLPLTRFLPTEYIPSEAERLGWYRRLAAVGSEGELQALAEELEDRFGALPPPVESLLLSVRIKLLAREARVSSLTVSREQIIMRTEPGGIYDRVSLHRRYGIQARISTNVLRIPRDVVGADWLGAVETILTEMVALRSALSRPQAAPA